MGIALGQCLCYSTDMDVKTALRAAMDENDLSSNQVARIGEVTDSAVWRILNGAQPNGSTLLKLMRGVPGFAEKLGFQIAAEANGHAA